MKVLFVNACVRGSLSRTEALAQKLIAALRSRTPDVVLETVTPQSSGATALNKDTLQKRERLLAEHKLDDPSFSPAHAFAEADRILIAAPYWDLFFPAALKDYLEQITVNGITFGYERDGTPRGLCTATALLYVTTAGGKIDGHNAGYAYLRALCEMYGIPETGCLSAEGLDLAGADIPAILQEAETSIPRYLSLLGV